MRRHFLAAALFVLAAAFMFAEDDISPDIQPDTLQLPPAETETAAEAAPGTELAPEEETLTEAETPPETETLTETETPPEEETLTEAETPPEEETLTEAETPPETETLTETETPPGEETLTETETPPEEETLTEAETLPETETLTETETPPEEETLTEAETPPETETLPKAEALSDGKRSGGKRAPPISVGLGLELNNNNRHGAAAGISAAADWRISPFLAAGLRAGFSSNFGYSDTLEGEGFARLILPVKTPLRGWVLELFAQGGMGISQIFAHEWASYSLLAGGGLGARFLKKSFFIEAIVRAGAPFLWAAGVSAGYRFGTGNGQ